MTKLNYKLMCLLFIGCISSGIAKSPDYKKEYSKKLHKTFDVDPGILLEVHNKYGDINITTWEKNIIEVDVLIKVKCSNQETAHEFLENVEIEFLSTRSRVKMNTIYPSQKNSSWWDGLFGFSKKIDYEVHYTIRAPRDMKTNLYNKYGDISQTNILGSTEVINKYGGIYLQEVGGDLDLSIGYGKSSVTSAKNISAQIKYSSFKIENCDDITMTSKYSEFDFGHCGNMVLTSKYDDFKIKSALKLDNNGKYDDWNIEILESISIDTKYTDLEIGKLSRKGVFNTSYGSVEINDTDNIDNINIISKYTDFDIEMSSDFIITFSGLHADLSVDKPYVEKDYLKEGSTFKTTLYRGSMNSKTKINAKMKYGNLEISN